MKNNQIIFYLDQESCLCRVSSCLYRVIQGFERTNRGMVVRLVDTSQILVNETSNPHKIVCCYKYGQVSTAFNFSKVESKSLIHSVACIFKFKFYARVAIAKGSCSVAEKWHFLKYAVYPYLGNFVTRGWGIEFTF